MSPTGVNITWSPNTEDNTSHYFFYRDKLRIGNVTENYFVDETLISNQNYRYAVAAVDTKQQKGLDSRHIFVNTSYGVVCTTCPPILGGTSGDGQVTLTWEVSSHILPPILEFLVYEEKHNNSDEIYLQLLSKVPFDNRSCTLKELNNSQEYVFRITAVSELGESVLSNKVTLTTKAVTPSTSPILTTTMTTKEITDRKTAGFDVLLSVIIFVCISVGPTHKKKRLIR